MNRIASVDITRGIVMLVMAIDHIRELVHYSALTADPLNLKTTSFALFATRWITHLCAPTFVFLAGVSVYLVYSNSKHQKTSKQFLIKRGVWLIFLEVTLVNFSVWFDLYFRTLMLQVIAAIGVGFLLLPFFLRLSLKQNLSIAIVLALICNLVARFDFPAYPVTNFIYHWLASPTVNQVTPGFMVFIAYPVLPWFAIMLAGYACGVLFTKPEEEHKQLFLKISLSLLGLFVVLRALNLFGDPSRFAVQDNFLFTLLSFVNVTKYPPSLPFILITLSVAFFFLFVSEKAFGRWKEILEVYGRVPMLYYILHFPLIHLITELIFLAQGYTWNELQFGSFQFGRPAGAAGVGLQGVYLIWLAVVIMLYPVCKKYAAYKKANPQIALLKYV